MGPFGNLARPISTTGHRPRNAQTGVALVSTHPSRTNFIYRDMLGENSMIDWIFNRFRDAKTAHATVMAIAGATGTVCCLGIIAIVVLNR